MCYSSGEELFSARCGSSCAGVGEQLWASVCVAFLGVAVGQSERALVILALLQRPAAVQRFVLEAMKSVSFQTVKLFCHLHL